MEVELLTYWQFWVVIGMVAFVIEIFTLDFTFFSVGVGALLTGLVSVFSSQVYVNLLAFALLTVVSLFLLRPRMQKVLFRGRRPQGTNVEAMIGKRARVWERIERDRGAVKLYGDIWPARSLSGESFEPGGEVVIERIEGITLYVRAAGETKDTPARGSEEVGG